MTTEPTPDWFTGAIKVAAVPRSDGRADLSPTKGQLVWTSTGEPLTDAEADGFEAAAEADPSAFMRWFRDAGGLSA